MAMQRLDMVRAGILHAQSRCNEFAVFGYDLLYWVAEEILIEFINKHLLDEHAEAKNLNFFDFRNPRGARRPVRKYLLYISVVLVDVTDFIKVQVPVGAHYGGGHRISFRGHYNSANSGLESNEKRPDC